MVLNLPNNDKARNASAKYGIPEDIENHIPEGVLGRIPNRALLNPVVTRNQETIFHAERDAKRELQIQVEQIIGEPKSLD